MQEGPGMQEVMVLSCIQPNPIFSGATLIAAANYGGGYA